MKKIILVLALIITCGTLQAESLWVDGQSKDLCADAKAKAVGDIVTIVIVEQASSTQQASTDVSKKTNTSIKEGVGPILSMLPEFGFSAGDKMTANGSTTRKTNFTAQLTAKVIEIKPNGNMVIEGIREVQTNKEKQTLKLRGMIRPNDITPDNTIMSTYIADAQITHEGTGPVGDRQKEGVITRILRIIF